MTIKARKNAARAPAELPFWRRKTFSQMTWAEWESLCDGCGRCCLNKLEDAETGEIEFTDVACRLLDLKTGRCTAYAERRRFVPDCIPLSPRRVHRIKWLPLSCAYRRLARGEDLEWWHPLVSGDPESVHRAGISVRGRAVSEAWTDDLENHVVDWPR
jgi:uncharacterized cysteine cluster protein YcgN (CxxCxxCC family)